MRKSEGLFADADWHSVERGQYSKMLQDIQDMDGDRLLSTPVEDLVGYFADYYRIDVPELLEDNISVDGHEVDIDVRHDRSRLIVNRTQPAFVTGTGVEVQVPFTGEAEVLRIRPVKCSMVSSQVRLAGNVITIMFKGK